MLHVYLARELAKVGLLNGSSVLSYAGFFTVNKTFNSNMYFWFFPSQVNIAAAFSSLFTARRYTLRGLSHHNSVRLSVCLSVCLSVTLVDCVHMVQPTIMISSPHGSPMILVFGDITIIPKFEGGHRERGR